MKQDILRKATEQFLQMGFKSVTMDDISASMGMSKKTLYKYFSNKEELVFESAKAVKNFCIENIQDILDNDYSAIKQNVEVFSMFRAMFQTIGTSPMYQLKKYYHDVHEQIIKDKTVFFRDIVKANLTKGIEDGVYRSGIDVDTIAEIYLSIIFSINEMNPMQSQVAKLEAIALDYHIRAISTTKGVEELEKLIKSDQALFDCNKLKYVIL